MKRVNEKGWTSSKAKGEALCVDGGGAEEKDGSHGSIYPC